MALWGFHANWQPVMIFYVVELTSGVSRDYCTDNDDLPGRNALPNYSANAAQYAVSTQNRLPAAPRSFVKRELNCPLLMHPSCRVLSWQSCAVVVTFSLNLMLEF